MPETTPMGQTFYAFEADLYAPEGCIAIGNEHGACMDRGCKWCWIYYDGPNCHSCEDPLYERGVLVDGMTFDDARQPYHRACAERLVDKYGRCD